jgi:hypothetical protein
VHRAHRGELRYWLCDVPKHAVHALKHRCGHSVLGGGACKSPVSGVYARYHDLQRRGDDLREWYHDRKQADEALSRPDQGRLSPL